MLLNKNIKEKNRLNKITIWDTAGQERFNSIVKVYFKSVHGAICMYDVTNINTLHHAERWIQQILSHYQDEEKPKIILVGNKIDLLYKSINEISNKKTFIEKNKTFINHLISQYNLLDHVVISSKLENINFIYEKLYKNIEIQSKFNKNYIKKR